LYIVAVHCIPPLSTIPVHCSLSLSTVLFPYPASSAHCPYSWWRRSSKIWFMSTFGTYVYTSIHWSWSCHVTTGVFWPQKKKLGRLLHNYHRRYS
jgi:hypothetical protein